MSELEYRVGVVIILVLGAVLIGCIVGMADLRMRERSLSVPAAGVNR